MERLVTRERASVRSEVKFNLKSREPERMKNYVSHVYMEGNK